MRATVVIPTFNRSGRLRELLDCFRAQRPGTLARIVVCDDGSSDDTADIVAGYGGLLPLEYCHQENLGFRAGQARNLGLARAVGDVVIFVDDDVLVAEDFVEQHLAAHAQSGTDSAKDGLQRRIAIGYRHRALGWRHAAPSADAIIAAEPDDRTDVLGPDGSGVTRHVTPWFFVYSCNFSVTLDPQLPRFDDAFVGWGMEDIEYGYRLHHMGYEVVAAPRARVLHIEDPAPRDPFRCEVRQLAPTYDSYVRNSVYFMDKYPDDAVLARLIRTDMRWYVRDAERNCWVKNGYANDVEAVLAFCRHEREQALHASPGEHRSRAHHKPTLHGRAKGPSGIEGEGT